MSWWWKSWSIVLTTGHRSWCYNLWQVVFSKNHHWFWSSVDWIILSPWRSEQRFTLQRDSSNTRKNREVIVADQDWMFQAVGQWGTMGIPGPETRTFQKLRCTNESLINAEQGVEKWELNGYSPTHNLALFSAWELTFEWRHCSFNLWSLTI